MPNLPEPRPRRVTPRLTLANLDWPVVVGIGALHLGALAAPFFFSWSALGLMVALVWITGGLGITLCYHRLLTHRSFQTPRWLEYGLTIIACTCWQGGPVQWVGVHRIHHATSDQPGDPHSPRHGFAWAHMLWCMIKKGEGGRDGAPAARDLLRDPVHRFLNRWFFVPQFGLVGLLAAGGWLLGGPWLAA